MNQTQPRTGQQQRGNPAPPPRPNNQPPPPAPPRPTEPPPTAEVKAAIPYRVTYHVVTPKGFPMDIQRDIGGSDLIAWVTAQDEAMVKAGFKPRDAEVRVELPIAATGGQNGGQVVVDDDSWIPKFCPDCGKPKETFYDNRTDPNRPPNGPDLKCRECDKGFWKTPPRGGQARRNNR
jgi:hypothetical protein